MVFFSPKVISSHWGIRSEEDFETALLNQPLRDFQKAVLAPGYPFAVASSALGEAVGHALRASEAVDEESGRLDIDALRLLAGWSLERNLARELPPTSDGEVQQALACLASRICLQDQLCRFASDLSACESAEQLDARIEEWNTQRDTMILSGPLSVERLQAVEALGNALRAWQESDLNTVHPAITAAQWRIIASLIRPPEELVHGEQVTIRAIRGLLRTPLRAMEQEWVSAEPRFSSGPVCDLRRKMAALRETPLAQTIPFEIWGILESVQSSWTRGSIKPPHGFDKVKEFLGIRATAKRVPQAEASASRVARPVTDRERAFALKIIGKQSRSVSEGGQGVRIPLLTLRPVGTQLHIGEFQRFRETLSVLGDHQAFAAIASPALGLESVQQHSVDTRQSDANPLQKLLSPAVLSPGFRILSGHEQLTAAIETEQRVVLALAEHRSDRELLTEAVVEYILAGEDDEDEFRSFLVESLQFHAQADEFKGFLEPLIERLQTAVNPSVREWLIPTVREDRSLSAPSPYAAVLLTLRQFEHSLQRPFGADSGSFSRYQESWENFLIEASGWAASSWARSHFLAAGLKALQALDDDTDRFEAALEALGCREVPRIAVILQRLYGESLLARTSSSPAAAQRLAYLRQMLSSSAWQVGWGPLARAIGPNAAADA